MTSRRLALAAALLLAAGPARAADVAAVLSSGSGAYLEAFSAFQAAYGAEVPHSEPAGGKAPLPPEVRTVVTFGNRASAAAYPPGVNVISVISPGLFGKPRGGKGRDVKIGMIPDFRRLFATIKRIQPSLSRLGVFRMKQTYMPYEEDMKAAGDENGISVVVRGIPDADELPAVLRGSMNEIDAFWLPPDPLLFSPETILIFTEFSWGNKLPMYASTKGLAREGACASIGISFAESGVAAAEAAKALAAGADFPAYYSPRKMEITLNASAAKRCGLTFSPEIMAEAAYLFP